MAFPQVFQMTPDLFVPQALFRCRRSLSNPQRRGPESARSKSCFGGMDGSVLVAVTLYRCGYMMLNGLQDNLKLILFTTLKNRSMMFQINTPLLVTSQQAMAVHFCLGNLVLDKHPRDSEGNVAHPSTAYLYNIPSS